MTMSTSSGSNNNYGGNGGGGGGGGASGGGGGYDHDQFGDTTLTKVFVGGLAWETPRELLWDHFQKFGDILEAVIISDKLTGRSKGYGFVTFKEGDSAKKACEDATPTINGRRANCNLASLGARRQRSSTTAISPNHHQQQTGLNPNPKVNGMGGPRSGSPAPVNNNNHIQQWYYYPAAAPPHASPYHHRHPYQPTMPFYRYSPTTYVSATDMGYNQKVNYAGGAPYMTGHFAHMYPAAGQPVMGGNNLMPVYPVYHFPHGPGAHIYSPTATGPIPTVASLISKPVGIKWRTYM